MLFVVINNNSRKNCAVKLTIQYRFYVLFKPVLKKKQKNIPQSRKMKLRTRILVL